MIRAKNSMKCRFRGGTWKSKQKGYLLVEAGIYLMVIAILAGLTAGDLVADHNQRIVEATAAEVHALSESALAYYDANGDWPDGPTEAGSGVCTDAIATMSGAGVLPPGIDAKSPSWSATNGGGTYTISCDPSLFSVQVTARPKYGAQLLSWLGGSTLAGDTITQTTPIPGSFPALNALLPRDGSRAMTGALDMGGNDMMNGGIVNATGFNWGANSLKDDQGGSIELGDSLTPGGRPYIDFHFGTGAAEDYNVRLINNANGLLIIKASNRVEVTGDLVAADVISADSGTQLSTSLRNATVVPPGGTVVKPACGSLTPQIFVAPSMFSPNDTGDPIGAVQGWAVDQGGNWKVNLRVLTSSGWVTPTSTYGALMVITKCS